MNLKTTFLGLFLLIKLGGFAQETTKVRDSTSTTFSFQDITLPDPESIEGK